MIALFDVDSLIYKAIYKIVSVADLREQLSNIDRSRNVKQQKTAIREWIVENSFNRLEQQAYKIMNDAEDCGMQFEKLEFYITYCLASERKKIDPTYKANRVFNKWANKLKAYIVEKSTLDCRWHLRWEADDLIADRAKTLRKQGAEYCVFSIDKDLLQIPGVHFNYYVEKKKSELKCTIPIDEYKENWREYQSMFFVEKTKTEALIYGCTYDYKGLQVVDQQTATNFVLTQMIIGDGCDNVKGIPGKGPAYANKILTDNPYQNARVVIEEYINHFGAEHRAKRRTNFRLLKIGI